MDSHKRLMKWRGSAQRNLEARLTRHSRRRKPLRWHIDYLSIKAPFVGALVLRGPRSWECRLAAILAKHYTRPIAQFGASDCRCGGHLFYCPAGAGRRPAESFIGDDRVGWKACIPCSPSDGEKLVEGVAARATFPPIARCGSDARHRNRHPKVRASICRIAPRPSSVYG